MTAAGLVLKVLLEHATKRGVRDLHTLCECGWISAAIADGLYEHVRHQADEIVKAQRKVARKASRTAKVAG